MLKRNDQLDRSEYDLIFHTNEIQVNQLGRYILINSAFVLTAILFLSLTGHFPISQETILPPIIIGLVELFVVITICYVVKDDRPWLKYLLIAGIIFIYSSLDSMLTHKVALLMTVPVIFSSRYFSLKLTAITTIMSYIAFGITAFIGATKGMIDLNIVTMEAGRIIVATGGFLGEGVENAGVSAEMLQRNTMIYDYIPKAILFAVVAVISMNIAARGRQMFLAKHEKEVQIARINNEMRIAQNIQEDMLPMIFPPFPERKELDLYASMDPAREVGGDFYDYFWIDDDHLYLTMSDVSGKGVPGALFMMTSLITLSNNAKLGLSPAEILTIANDTFCSGNNREDMFVTVWLGILEVSTGILTAANAGHEYPIIRHGRDGRYELYKDPHCFVVGGMRDIPFNEYEITLEPGSMLFLYTDGVPEATNRVNEMYGTDRLVQCLNDNLQATPEQIVHSVRESVDVFTNGAEQFDDLTMLCLEYKRGDNHE